MNEVNEMSSTMLDAVATTSSTVLQQPSTKLVVLTIINSVLLLAIILFIASYPYYHDKYISSLQSYK